MKDNLMIEFLALDPLDYLYAQSFIYPPNIKKRAEPA